MRQCLERLIHTSATVELPSSLSALRSPSLMSLWNKVERVSCLKVLVLYQRLKHLIHDLLTTVELIASLKLKWLVNLGLNVARRQFKKFAILQVRSILLIEQILQMPHLVFIKPLIDLQSLYNIIDCVLKLLIISLKPLKEPKLSKFLLLSKIELLAHDLLLHL